MGSFTFLLMTRAQSGDLAYIKKTWVFSTRGVPGVLKACFEDLVLPFLLRKVFEKPYRVR